MSKKSKIGRAIDRVDKSMDRKVKKRKVLKKKKQIVLKLNDRPPAEYVPIYFKK